MTYRRILEIDPSSPGDVQRAASSENDPKVSVILPIYNAQEFIVDALARVERLKGVDFELVLVDDGSIDETWTLAEAKDMSIPVTLVRLIRNAGVARARNFALKFARGRYIWMIDGDDSWPDDALEQLVAAADRSRAGMVVAQATKLIVSSGEREEVTTPTRIGDYDHEQMVDALLEGGLRGHLWNKLFRTDVLGEDPFPIMRSKSDYCMIIRRLPAIRSMTVISENVYEYRYQLGSITNSSVATPLDLMRCYEEALFVKDELDVDKASVEKFRFFSIAQIAYSEIWRYGNHAVGREAVEAYLRGMLTVRGLRQLVRKVSYKKLALAISLKFMPSLMGTIYRRRRSHRWSPAAKDAHK